MNVFWIRKQPRGGFPLTMATVALALVVVLGQMARGESVARDSGHQVADVLAVGDDRISWEKLNLQVSDDVALLSGEVESIDDREWVVDHLFMNSGIVAVVQDVEVSQDGFDPAAATKVLQSKLKSHPGMAGSGLHARVTGGGLARITGQACNRDALKLARELSSRIPGIQTIKIDAAINPMLPRPPGAVVADIHERLRDDPLLAHLPVEVSFNNGVLRFFGEVPDFETRERLFRSAMIGGVMDIGPSSLVVNPELEKATLADKFYHPVDALQALKKACAKDSRIGLEGLDLSLENGWIVISGDDERSRAAALENAFGLPGAIGIREVAKQLPINVTMN